MTPVGHDGLGVVGVVGVEDVLRALRQRVPLPRRQAVQVVRRSEWRRRKHVQLVQFGTWLNITAPANNVKLCCFPSLKDHHTIFDNF